MKTKITIGNVTIEIETDEVEKTAERPPLVIIDERHKPPPGEEKKPVPGNGAHHLLSQRELRILELVGDGLSNKSIALRLCNTESTVKVHMKSILRKLQVKNRTQAALYHQQNGAAA